MKVKCLNHFECKEVFNRWVGHIASFKKDQEYVCNMFNMDRHGKPSQICYHITDDYDIKAVISRGEFKRNFKSIKYDRISKLNKLLDNDIE